MAETSAAVDRASADIPLTRSARDILELAVEAASHRNTTEATPTDVLRSLLGIPGTLATEAMRALGVDPVAVATKLGADGEAPALPLPLRQLVVNANREAQVLGHHQVDSIHLLLALMYTDARPTAAILQSSGLTLYDVRRQLQTGATTASSDRSLRRRPLPRLGPVLGVSPIFIALVVLTAATAIGLFFDLLPGADNFLTLAFVVGGWVISVCVHEFGHAAVAYLGGDRDVAASGYLTLNPLKYTNVLMSIVFPVFALLLGGYALPGGAVFVNWAALRSKSWDSLVSLAGPATNALFALVIAAVFWLALHLQWITIANVNFFGALALLGFFEVFATLLNLVPIPPLDGFGIMRPWLPWSVQASAARFGMAGYLLIFFLLFYVRPVAGAIIDLVSAITTLLGIHPFFVTLGDQNMRFR